jgi:hypothetical protein
MKAGFNELGAILEEMRPSLVVPSDRALHEINITGMSTFPLRWEYEESFCYAAKGGDIVGGEHSARVIFHYEH